MKARISLSILIFVLALLISVGSCVSGKKMIDASDALKPFYGDWVNTDNTGYPETKSQRYVINPDNKMDIYAFTTDAKPIAIHEITDVLECWIDRKGNTYVRVKVWCHTWNGVRYYLLKVDESEDTLEMNYVSGENLPPETIVVNPDLSTPNYYYNIYHRQE